MALKKNWGDILMQQRKTLGLSQDDVAKALGKTRTYVSYMENQKRQPSANDLGVHCEVLGLDISSLYDNTVTSKLSTIRLIQAARMAKNMDIGELARHTGIDFFRLGNAELGDVELTPHETHKIAEVLEIDEERLKVTEEISISKWLELARQLGVPERKLPLLRNFVEDCRKE